MAVITWCLPYLLEFEHNKMGQLQVSCTFRNYQPDTSIKGVYVVLTNTTPPKMEIAVFEDKSKAALSTRWEPLRTPNVLYIGKDLRPDLWEYAVKHLEVQEMLIMPTYVLAPPEGKASILIRKLTKDLSAACRDNLQKLTQLTASDALMQELLGSEEKAVEKLKSIFQEQGVRS